MDKPEYEKILSRETLAGIEANYGIKFDRVEQLFSGADKNSFLYKVRSNKTDFFLKLRTGDFDAACIEIPYLLSRAGFVHAIPPVKTTEDTLFLKLRDFALVLYPFIDGKSAIETGLSETLWEKLGGALRMIHEFKLPENSVKLPKETYDSGSRTKLKKILGGLAAMGRKGDNEKRFVSVYAEKAALIHSMIEDAENLLAGIKNTRPEYCLCHGDLHAGNILVSGENNFYIVDWDTLTLAPKEKDLMFIGGGVANTWNKKEEETWFYRGYGEAAPVDRNIVRYFRLERIIIDLVEFHEQFFRENISGENQLAIIELAESVFYPDGVVDMAFK